MQMGVSFLRFLFCDWSCFQFQSNPKSFTLHQFDFSGYLLTVPAVLGMARCSSLLLMMWSAAWNLLNLVCECPQFSTGSLQFDTICTKALCNIHHAESWWLEVYLTQLPQASDFFKERETSDFLEWPMGQRQLPSNQEGVLYFFCNLFSLFIFINIHYCSIYDIITSSFLGFPLHLTMTMSQLGWIRTVCDKCSTHIIRSRNGHGPLSPFWCRWKGLDFFGLPHLAQSNQPFLRNKSPSRTCICPFAPDMGMGSMFPNVVSETDTMCPLEVRQGQGQFGLEPHLLRGLGPKRWRWWRNPGSWVGVFDSNMNQQVDGF